MIPVKQTVYLRETHHYDWLVKSHNDDLIDHVKQAEGYFFTPEQLNEYTQSVIKQSLETAAKKAFHSPIEGRYFEQEVNKQSITNTFEETFNNWKV